MPQRADTNQQQNGEQLMETLNNYREAIIFLSLVGIFMTGVYLGIITERQKWGN